MGLPRNDDDDDDEKKPWTHSCFELSLGHHLPNYWRGAPACVCVCAIITTFSKHLRPPGPVFIAGNRDGPTLVRRTISEDGRGKKTEGLRGAGWPEGGVRRDGEPAEAREVRLRRVEREMSQRAGFLWENGLQRPRSTPASRTGFHNLERARNIEKAVTEMERLDLVSENHQIEYIKEDFFSSLLCFRICV